MRTTAAAASATITSTPPIILPPLNESEGDNDQQQQQQEVEVVESKREPKSKNQIHVHVRNGQVSVTQSMTSGIAMTTSTSTSTSTSKSTSAFTQKSATSSSSSSISSSSVPLPLPLPINPSPYNQLGGMGSIGTMNEGHAHSHEHVQMHTNNTTTTTTIPSSSSSTSTSTSTSTSNTTNNNFTMLQDSVFGQKSAELSERSRRLAEDLAEFVERAVQEMNDSQKRRENGSSLPCDDKEAELQLQTARMIRQFLPGNRELLPIVQEKGWTQLLLGWLNLHDRPAVQVEALLALTSIADLCQSSPTGIPDASSIIPPIGQPNGHGHGPMGMAMDGTMNLTHPFLHRGSLSSNSQSNSHSHPSHSQHQQQQQQQQQYNPYAYPYMPWNYDPSQANNLTPQMLNDPAVQAAINGGGLQHLLTTSALQSAAVQFSGGDSSSSSSSSTIGATTASTMNRKESQKNDNNNNKIEKCFDPSGLNGCGIVGNAGDNAANYFKLSLPTTTTTTTTSNTLEGDHNNDTSTESIATAPGPLNGASTVTPQITPSILSALTSSFPSPLPPQPSSYHNSSGISGVAGIAPPMMANFTQPMSQNLLLNNAEALPTLISLLSSPNKEVHEHAMWILGNIAAASSGTSTAANIGGGCGDPTDKSSSKVSVKEVLLSAGVMAPLLNCLELNSQNLSLQRIGSWTISNLVETKMQQGKSGKNTNGSGGNGNSNGGNHDIDIELLIPTLRRLLGSVDNDILNYTCWALSHLCDGPASHIAAVVTTKTPKEAPCGLVPRLVQLLHHENWRVTKPALRTIGNIVCAEYDEDASRNGNMLDISNINSSNNNNNKSSSHTPTDFTDVILECVAVPRLKSLIAHSNREIQKEACWTLSNIAAGTVDQIQAVIDSGAIQPLVQLVNNKKTDQEVRSEACWVVLNATSCGSDQQIGVLVAEGCVSVLGLLLEETTMVSMALEGLERVLQVEKNREIARKEKLGGGSNSSSGGSSGSGSGSDGNNPHSPLVNPSLVENAMAKSHNQTSKVSKKVRQIWDDHFVSCALCNKPYSKHRPSDAKFCEECKCHVCSSCNCEIYHLSYQEELWAATEEKVVATKQAKKSKKQKKKEKRKEKNKTKTTQETSTTTKSSYINENHNKAKGKKEQDGDTDTSESGGTGSVSSAVARRANQKQGNAASVSFDEDDGANNTMCDLVETEKNQQPPIDFSLYLQQTGSIIALSRLMDDFYNGNGYKKFNEDVVSIKCVKLPNQ